MPAPPTHTPHMQDNLSATCLPPTTHTPHMQEEEMSLLESGGLGHSTGDEETLGGRSLADLRGSRGMSLEMRETGLSAVDTSGDLDLQGADLAETAEWN